MKISITFDTDDETGPVHDMVDRVFGETKAPATSNTKETPAEAKKRKAAEKKKADAEAEAEAESDGGGEPGITRDDVREKLKQYAAIDGKDAAIQILKDNGAASIGELDEASFAAVVEACG